MSVFYVLVPLALVLAGAAVLAFRWAVRAGQFDDVETPALRILLDDSLPESAPQKGDSSGAVPCRADEPHPSFSEPSDPVSL